MTTAFLEPFDTFFRFLGANTTGWTIVAGRNGTALQCSAAATVFFPIPSTLESATVTLGFAWQQSSLATGTNIIFLYSDNAGQVHISLTYSSTGALSVRRGGPAGTTLGTTAAGVVVANTWHYIELQVTMSDTVGVVNLNVDGVSVLALINQDTKNAGTKAVFDSILLQGNSGLTTKYDDMYVATGGGESFRGSQVIPSIGEVALTRQATRVGFDTSPGPTRNYRQSLRVAMTRLGFFDATALKVWNGSAFVASATGAGPTDVTVEVWDGAAFVDGDVKVWGSPPPVLGCTDVLSEPFENFNNWVTVSSPPIAAGRTGTAASFVSNADLATYTIPPGLQSEYMIVGFAVRTTDLAFGQIALSIRGDAAGTEHLRMVFLNDGAIQIGRSSVGVLGQTAAGVIAINTWYYVEVRSRIHDTLGEVQVRVNGTTVLSLTADTRNGGTSPIADSVRLSSGAGATTFFDDLYISTGSGCSFQGDQSIYNDVLLEPFNNFIDAPWTLAGGNAAISSLVTGRYGTGTAAESTTGEDLCYLVPTALQSITYTLGFAFRLSSVAGNFTICQVRTNHVGSNMFAIEVLSDGSIRAGRTGSPSQVVSAVGAVVANVWYYVELKVTISNTAGFVDLRLNGTSVAATFSGDTNGGFIEGQAPTSIVLPAISGITVNYDDFYLTSGGGPFKGDPNPPPIVCTEVLHEPFNHLGRWTNSGATIVPGRNGTAVQASGTTAYAQYSIAGPSDVLTVGFAWRYTDIGNTLEHTVARFYGDAGATRHAALHILPRQGSSAWGVIGVYTGSGAFLLASVNTAAPLVQNTWYYIEMQIKLHDTTGFVTVRLDGTQVIAVTNIDTKNGGTGTTYDRVRLGETGAGPLVNQYDDLYLSTGAPCTFQGDHVEPNDPGDVLYEPFNDLTTNSWAIVGTATIVAGRTGTAAQLSTSGASASYTIPSPSRSEYLTIGFAVKTTDISDNIFMHFRSNAAANLEITATMAATGAVEIRQQATLLATSAASVIAINTWYYFELQIRHHTTLGSVVARINGVQVAAATNVNTFNTATIDTLRLFRDTGATILFDDLYIASGPTATFKGDITIP